MEVVYDGLREIELQQKKHFRPQALHVWYQFQSNAAMHILGWRSLLSLSRPAVHRPVKYECVSLGPVLASMMLRT